MPAHACDPSTREVEAGGSGIQGSLVCIERPCLKIETEDRASPHPMLQTVIHSAGLGGLSLPDTQYSPTLVLTKALAGHFHGPEYRGS